MRQKQRIQPSLLASWPDHPRALELAVISKILDEYPGIAEAAWQDLTKGKRTDTGADGMEAMSVVRTAILLKTGDHSYESLHFHLVDSTSSGKATIQSNLKVVQFIFVKGDDLLGRGWMRNSLTLRFDGRNPVV